MRDHVGRRGCPEGLSLALGVRMRDLADLYDGLATVQVQIVGVRAPAIKIVRSGSRPQGAAGDRRLTAIRHQLFN